MKKVLFIYYWANFALLPLKCDLIYSRLGFCFLKIPFCIFNFPFQSVSQSEALKLMGYLLEFSI